MVGLDVECGPNILVDKRLEFWTPSHVLANEAPCRAVIIVKLEGLDNNQYSTSKWNRAYLVGANIIEIIQAKHLVIRREFEMQCWGLEGLDKDVLLNIVECQGGQCAESCMPVMSELRYKLDP